MDFSLITGAVNWSGVLSGLTVVALAIAALLVAMRGVDILLGFIDPYYGSDIDYYDQVHDDCDADDHADYLNHLHGRD